MNEQEQKTILLVEDEALIAVMEREMLERHGFNVILASSGEKAINAVRDTPVIDLILMDINLGKGKMDGTEAAEIILKEREIPVLFLSSYTQAEVVQKTEKTASYGYVVKSSGETVLITSIKMAFKLSDAHRRLEEREGALQESEDRYRRITEGLSDYLYTVLIEDGRVVQTTHNPACEAVTGYTSGEFASNPYLWIDMVPKQEHNIINEHVKNVLSGKNISAIEHHIVRKDGKIIWVSDTPILKIDSQGVLISYDGVIKDITEHRKLEEQLRHAQKMESIGLLAGGIAHDFNNILGTIMGYGEMALMKMAADEPLRLNIKRILESVNKAAHLTKDLLLFSRKQTAKKKPVDLCVIVKTVGKILMRVLGEDVECKTIIPAGDIPILADANHIEQILMNLATNARDAMPNGGTFTMTVEKTMIDDEFIAVHGYGNAGMYAIVIVADTGKGMDAETRQKIFEPFFTTKEVGKGTGLGMAVVYGIIKQHEGFVNVYSEPGMGTTFRIYLPLIKSAASLEETATDRPYPVGGAETILLAEDDESFMKMTAATLKGFGYNVITAFDGEDAVKKFSEHKNSIKLLLFDIIMPRQSGKDAYDAIVKIKPDIKVIFLSGYAPEMVRQKVSIESGTSVISKPISPITLLKEVRKVLDDG